MVTNLSILKLFRGGGRCIVNVVDEILSQDPKAAGLAINWHIFGSNGQDKADYSHGVLERFTRRAPNDIGVNKHVKTIANPRLIDFVNNPHFVVYFKDYHAASEKTNIVEKAFNEPANTEKIVINHYHCKSREEYKVKIERGRATREKPYTYEQFEGHDRNEEFDDEILKYRDERAKIYQPPNKVKIENRVLNALMKNLAPVCLPNTPQEFYEGKMETFLTCRAVSSWLKEKLEDNLSARLFEEMSLKAIIKTLSTKMTEVDNKIFIRELPKLLRLPHSHVEKLRTAAFQFISQKKDSLRFKNMWKEFVELEYLQDCLNLKE